MQGMSGNFGRSSERKFTTVVFDDLGQEGRLIPWPIDPPVSRTYVCMSVCMYVFPLYSAPPRIAAPPPRRAPPQAGPLLVCLGFEFDRWV